VSVEEAVGFAVRIPGWMHPHELRWLYARAAQLEPGDTWVEIGAWKGRSTAAVLHGLPPAATLVAIDTWRGSGVEGTREAEHGDDAVFRAFLENMAQAILDAPDRDLCVMRGDSATVASRLNILSAVVFIDGDHEQAAVSRDLDAWKGRAALLCGHDRGHPDVQAALAWHGIEYDEGPGGIWIRR